jgi:transcriptional regulator with XRE-family HTH domain
MNEPADATTNEAEAGANYAAELGRWRTLRGLTKKALAEQMAYDRTYVSHIERGNLPPTRDFTERAEQVLETGGALWACWEALTVAKANPQLATIEPAPSDRELRTVEFVSWIADHSSLDFATAYQAVAATADQLETETAATRHARAHQHAAVTRADLAAAVTNYYGPPPDGYAMYAADIDGEPLDLSILTTPAWTGTATTLEIGAGQSTFRQPDPAQAIQLDEATRRAAIARLATAELADTVMVNNPTYRLTNIDLNHDHLAATFTLSDFATFAFTTDLIDAELLNAVASHHTQPPPDALPLRARHLPDIGTALDLESRHCGGGTLALVAIARPATNNRPADYIILVQERSGQVLNVTGKLAVIPKAFHQPITDPAEEADLATNLLRELEEELLGRQDLEQLGQNNWRQADPLHHQHRSEPLAALLNQPDALRMELTGYGINLTTGNYELACLIVIDDETWWTNWGHLVEANWEAMRIHRYSTHDTQSLTRLAHDQRWSNEGLFAYLEGLRRLNQLDPERQRTTIPPISLKDPP